MSLKITKRHPEVCEHYCTNIVHGNLITAALTKTDVSDEALIYYMLGVCEHFSTARDSVGRSAIHVAASCGRTSMVTWLVTYRNGNLEDRDRESGYTALHRSLFYGKINTAVALIKLGSDMNAVDEESLSPLEHVMKDALSKFTERKFAMSGKQLQGCSNQSSDDNYLGELYCWGSNSNYILLDRHERSLPELSHFHKYYPDKHIDTIHLEKYHCMVTCGSRVYAWGHGLGGRLGLNTNSTVLVPGAIRIELKPNRYSVKHFSTQHLDVARDHSIFLDIKSYVWVCGLNEHFVLGVPCDEPAVLQPVCVASLKDKKIIGVACGKYHSVAYSKDALYTWGLNGGQLGHAGCYGPYLSAPKKVTHLLDGENNTIIQVCCSDAAVGILASNNAIYLLNDFQRRRIVFKSPSAYFRQLYLYGGKLDAPTTTKVKLVQTHELHVAVVTMTANMLLWRESDPQLRRCVFTLGRPLAVGDVVLNKRGCVFTTCDHEVFLGTFKVRKSATTAAKLNKNKEKERELGKSAFHVFLEKAECVLVNVNKVKRIHRACYVTSDPDGENFIVLQNNRCKEFFPDKSSIINGESFPQESSIKTYLNTLRDGYCDKNSLHDFEFIVGNRTFYCHKYILAHASTELSSLIRETIDNVYIVEAIPADTFEQMLQFIYTGKSDVANLDKLHKKDGTTVTDSEKHQEQNESSKDNIKDITAFAVYNQESNKASAKHIESDKSATPQLKLLLACAKKFGLRVLQKRIDHYLEHLRIRSHVCAACFDKIGPVVQYQRKEFLDFSDIDVICSNGEKIKAHKCMLMRLDYFRNMFSARWNQTQTAIKIDYPPMHVQHLVDFIYTDKLSDDIPDMQNLLILLVLSDEFIVSKLRALCEYSLCKHINIKTFVHLYQCSVSYGACILKNICSQFIVAHLTEVLELRSLDAIEDAHLIEISKIYLKQKSRVFDKRLITPCSYVSNIEEPPNDFCLELLEATKYQAIETQKVIRKRTRRHKTSSASETANESIEVLESESNINNVINSQTIAKPANRFVAITSASKKLNESLELDGEFTNLSLLNRSLVSSSWDESEFPDLSPVNLSGNGGMYSKSPGKSYDWRSLPKLSQKARKSLQSETNCSAGIAVLSTAVEKRGNPWKIVDLEANVSGPLPSVQNDLFEIVKLERLQRDKLNKMRNKSLCSTQIEDKAIFDLRKFYNIDYIEDELIEVRRIESGNVASPTWVAKN